ncbi:unnamed protein product [Didymodactylos carnosus]|uniref:Inhibitor of growth protein n=1 Tax=Didymodactylos carnosus TaxID=1234261 RepID=A0A813YN23_9BILA|nr:unnamed protein product [Didymodactylos carnosus]CAF0886423.1 unnamed protein product [Didymodactylos carnosus]CAF3537839.1 unnamed protein product [Didymodactylos carnosus]CAF3671582.1 unnamed protein product [Didymodactylos carnosus]
MEFEEFVESLESLPIDLSRNLRLLRELDDKNLQLRQECLNVSDKYKQEIDSIQKRENIKMLNDIQLRRLQLADEKVVLAEQAAELCEKHIRRLDDILDYISTQKPIIKKSDIHNKKRSLSTSADDQNSINKKRKTKQVLHSVLNKKQLSETRTPIRVPRKLLQSTNTLSSEEKERIAIEEYGMEIDPSEPRYCTCNQVSFGRMIKCDNESCPLEWFHFQCVNVEVAPKAHELWFCPQCREKNKHK